MATVEAVRKYDFSVIRMIKNYAKRGIGRFIRFAEYSLNTVLPAGKQGRHQHRAVG
jgi:hypothetical protein